MTNVQKYEEKFKSLAIIKTNLNISLTWDLGKYLRVPIAWGRNKKAIFQHILDKINTRLLGWKNKLLNAASCPTLVKSMITTILLYSTQTCWLPASICEEINKKAWSFFWTNKNGQRVHLLRWETMTSPEIKGGLNICSARNNNLAMLGKISWELIRDSDKLWIDIFN